MSGSWSVVLGSLLLGPVARAQAPGDFEIWPDVLLEANTQGSGYMVNGVGAPSVVFDPDAHRYYMVFEVRLPQTEPDCPYGLWGLGLAVSDDGVSNWNALPNPILDPLGGTYYACVAAHPEVIYNAATKTLSVFFKAEQTDPPDPVIGPDRFTGVGRLRMRVLPSGGFRKMGVSEAPVLPVNQNFGMPRVVYFVDQFYMGLTLRPDMWMATGLTASAFTLGSGPVLQPSGGNPEWTADELFNASLVCETDPVYPFSVFIGGYDLGPGGQIDYGGWGKAVSSDTLTWLLGTDPYFEFSGGNDWRHWDVIRVGESDYIVYFDEKDPNGANRIRFASTVDAWADGDVNLKICL